MAAGNITGDDSNDVKKLFNNSRTRAYRKNQIIKYQNDPLDAVYLIRRGYLKAYTILESGDTRTILLLGRGDIFPIVFSETLDWQDYQIRYFYQSLTDVELWVNTSDAMQKRITSDPNLTNIYLKDLSASNKMIMNQLEIMKNKTAIDKILLSLPYLIEKSGKRINPNICELQLKLSHQEIADLTGVTRETTTILVKELGTMKILDQHHGNWRINLANLQKAIDKK